MAVAAAGEPRTLAEARDVAVAIAAATGWALQRYYTDSHGRWVACYTTGELREATRRGTRLVKTGRRVLLAEADQYL